MKTAIWVGAGILGLMMVAGIALWVITYLLIGASMQSAAALVRAVV